MATGYTFCRYRPQWSTIEVIRRNISPLTGYIQQYFNEMRTICANTIQHDIGLDWKMPQLFNTEIFLVALFSIVSPFIFISIISWCCRSKKEGLDEVDARASTSQKYEAMRWYKQADCDLTAANSDIAFPGAYEWCCMKCQQVISY